MWLTIRQHWFRKWFGAEQAASHYLDFNIRGLTVVNTLRPRQNGRHFADDTFKRIFLNENVRILIKISLKFVPEGPINNIPALAQIMAWRRPGDKPLYEPMMIRLPTHICVTRPLKSRQHGRHFVGILKCIFFYEVLYFEQNFSCGSSSQNILAGLWLNCISSVEITLFLLADILLQHRALSLFRSTCKLIQSLFLQWFVKLMGPSLFSFIILIVFFLG